MKFDRKTDEKSTRNLPTTVLRIRPSGADSEEFQTLTMKPRANVLETLLRNKISIAHSCGGFGTCGTCRVKVCAGLDHLFPRNEVERDMAKDRSFTAEERLACQSYVMTAPPNEIEIEIPEFFDENDESLYDE